MRCPEMLLINCNFVCFMYDCNCDGMALCVCLNSRYTVVLNGRQIIREGFIKQSFSDRPERYGMGTVWLNTHRKGKVLPFIFPSW